MVVYFYKAECQAEKIGHYLQSQGHSQDLCNQNKTISIISSRLLVRLQPGLVWKYSIISQSVLQKNWITAFKVRVRAKVKNVIEYLSG